MASSHGDGLISQMSSCVQISHEGFVYVMHCKHLMLNMRRKL